MRSSPSASCSTIARVRVGAAAIGDHDPHPDVVRPGQQGFDHIGDVLFLVQARDRNEDEISRVREFASMLGS